MPHRELAPAGPRIGGCRCGCTGKCHDIRRIWPCVGLPPNLRDLVFPQNAVRRHKRRPMPRLNPIPITSVGGLISYTLRLGCRYPAQR